MKKVKMVTAFLFLAFLAFLAFFADSVEAQSKQNLNEESNLPQDRSRQMTLYQTTANTPGLMSYMGHLADAAGKPITASTSVTFSIYAAATGGTASWSETHNIIPAFTGTFGVTLGSITPILSTLFKDNSNLYLGVKVANDVEMTPRQKISSAAFAFSAEVASPREGYGAPVAIGTANASGTAISLARSDHVHQGVRSLARSGSSSLYGDVTLSAGVNAILTQSGQNLEFSVPPNAFARMGRAGSPTLTGDIVLAEGTNIALSQSGQTITISGGAANFTQGSVVFAGASGVYSQDNSNLFWDDTNNRLGIGTAGPLGPLDVRNGSFSVKGVSSAYSDSTYQDYNGLVIHTENQGGVGSFANIIATGADAGSSPSNIAFWTRASGSAINPVERMRIDKDGLVNILTGNLKVGDGTPDVSSPLNGEDAYIEGTLEIDGNARLDGTLTFGNDSIMTDITLQNGETIDNETDKNISLTVPADGRVNIVTGNLVVGSTGEGSPVLDGGDAFIEGVLEVGGNTKLDSALEVGGNATFGSATTHNLLTVLGNTNAVSINVNAAIATNFEVKGLFIQQQFNNSNLQQTLDSAIEIDNADNNVAILDAIKITSTGGGAITTAINIATPAVATDITLQNGESIDNDTDSRFLFKANSDATVTIAAADSVNSNTPLTISSAGTGALALNPAGTGKVGIGTAAPNGTLHVRTSGPETVTPNPDADDLVVQNSSDDYAGISIISDNALDSAINFGSPNDVLGSFIKWNLAPSPNPNTGTMTIGTHNTFGALVFSTGNDAERMRIQSDGKVGIGTTAPEGTLHVHTASAGVVTARSTGDDLVVEHSSIGGISILTPNADSSHLFFGSLDDNVGAFIAWNYDLNEVHIGTEKIGADIVFKADNNSEKMRVTDAGRVGIGTTAPEGTLHVHTASAGTVTPNSDADDLVVENSSHAGISIISFNNNNSFIKFGSPNDVLGAFIKWDSDSENMEIGTDSTFGDLQFFTGVSSRRMAIDKDGNVEIGSPTTLFAKLHVEGIGGSNVPGINVSGTYAYLNGNAISTADPKNPFRADSNNNTRNSIFGSDRITTGTEFNAFSDARIKNILGVSIGAADLNTLRQIEVVDFRYKDRRKDDGLKKKVIGQQLAKVYPQAVHFMTAVVADIMRDATLNGRVITLPDHGLNVGDRVKLIFEAGDVEKVYKVLSVTQDTFTVDENKQGGVFVYGREVNDFHIVDYEAIAMLNVSATQEQQKIIATQQKQIESLQAEIKAIRESLISASSASSASEVVGLR